jgi:hypothetical protein
MFMVSNVDTGNFQQAAFSTDGGATWTRRNIATGSDGLTAACCDPSLAWDAFGNLYFCYLNDVDTQVIIARSTNGGQSFTQVATLGANTADQPTIAVGPGQNGIGGSVWVLWDMNGQVLSGASVTGLGTMGFFSLPATVPGGGTGVFGDLAVGPQGQVMVVYQQGGTANNPSQVYMNLDPDGLGAQPLGAQKTLFTTNVGDFYNIPAQDVRTIDSEVGLAWDRSGGPHNGRVYLMDTDAPAPASSDTNIFTRFSDNNGATWSAPVRVNDDLTNRSQFLPRIALDQATGYVAVTWHDSRNDDGSHGMGDTNGFANDDAQLFGAVSTDFGASFSPNLQISAGTSNAAVSGSGIEFGDYTGLAFQSGKFFPAWSDNSNSTADNPDGALHAFDIYTARVNVLLPGTPGRYSVVANSSTGAANLNFADHDTSTPTVSITPVSPSPRTTPVSSIAITFSEPVSNFDLSHLQLTRDGVAISLASATLTTSDNTTYTLGNLQSLTTPAGAYLLTLTTAGASTIHDSSGNALGGGTSTSFTVNSTIADHHLFYNNSFWTNPANGFTNDDAAIDPSKTPLLNGGTGSFANYSGALLGINGIMVDINDLPAATPAATDFTFKVGNDDTPSGWAAAPNPATIIIRRGAGTGGSDRVELIWPDNAIQNTWLQVTVKANGDTGLVTPDVFYFGNAIGETGNNPANASVNSGDIIAVRDHPTSSQNPALISNPYDFNHDSSVNSADMIIARDHPSSSSTELRFIHPTVASASVASTAATAAATATRARPTAASIFTPPSSRNPQPAAPRKPHVWD